MLIHGSHAHAEKTLASKTRFDPLPSRNHLRDRIRETFQFSPARQITVRRSQGFMAFILILAWLSGLTTPFCFEKQVQFETKPSYSLLDVNDSQSLSRELRNGLWQHPE
jgi:hypothetical protein